jgi:broad specificity phosphatase PhoE
MRWVDLKCEGSLMFTTGYLRRIISVGWSRVLVLWIYLSVGWRFWRWWLRLWHRQSHTTESMYIDMKRTLLLIRHGQTTWNAENILPGRLPGVRLNDKGRQQVAKLAEALTVLPISAIISSPLERARDTAEIIAQPRGLCVQFEPDLMDTDVGRWAGKNYNELNKNDPEWNAYKHNPTVAPEGVETFPQVQERAVAAVERWLKKETLGAYPAFVAHADVVKLLIAHYTGLDAGRAGVLFIDNASVSVVEVETDQLPKVIAISWSPRPGWLRPPVPEKPKEKVEQEQQPSDEGQPVQS